MGLSSRFLAFVLLALGFASAGQGALAQSTEPGFAAAFSPSSVSTGGVSTLTFTIDNSLKPDVTGLGFTASLPTTTGGTSTAAMMVVGAASHTCDAGTVTVSTFNRVVTFAGGALRRDASCEVSVSVTAGADGTYTLSGVALANSAGADVVAADQTLTVSPASTNLTLVKALNRTATQVDETLTATYTLTNAGTGNLFNPTFSETFPDGVSVATPSNGAFVCDDSFSEGALTVNDGGQSLAYFGGFFLPGISCQITVDLVGTRAGTYALTSSPATSGGQSSAVNTVVLEVSAAATDAPQISKRFTQSSVVAGQSVDLEFTITNASISDTMTGVTFTDDLDAMVTGAVATGLPVSDACGTGSSVSGTSVLSLTGGTIAPRTSCTFTVPVQIPASAPNGTIINTTGPVTASIGGAAAVGADTASAQINVLAAADLSFSKVFSPATTAPGSTVSATYTITNNGAAASDIAFEEDFGLTFSPLTAPALTTGSNVCGAGSVLSANSPDFSSAATVSTLTGGSLGAGASCIFSVSISLSPDQLGGTFTSTSSALRATVGGQPATGPASSGELTVTGGTQLSMAAQFLDILDGINDGAVTNGQQFQADFTLTTPRETGGSASAIAFTFNAADLAAGTTASVAANTCGGSAVMDGTNETLSVAGGAVGPDSSCTVSLTITAGGGTNATQSASTSAVSYQEGGATTQVNGAGASIYMGDTVPLALQHSFTPASIAAGDTGQITYIITNPNAATGVTSAFFTHNFSSIVSGTNINPTPVTNTCGAAVSGTSFGIMTNIAVPANDSCTLTLDVTVPAGAASGSYSSTTSAISDAGSSGVPAGAASAAILTVDNDPVLFSKAFLTGPIAAGNSVDLQFTITNPLGTALTGITFTDDLDAMLAGSVAGAASANTCGGAASGGAVLSFSGGTLAAGASCTLTVPVTLPAGAAPGSYLNTTSALSATAGAGTVSALPASASVTVGGTVDTVMTVAFSPDVIFPGGTTTATYTIRNNNASALEDLRFSHDLAGTTGGTTATSVPGNGLCGAGSSLTGTGTLSFLGGRLAAGAQCSFSVPLSVPASATPSTYTSATKVLTVDGLQVGQAASAPLTVINIVDLSSTITDGLTTISAGGTATYTAVVSNAGPSTEAAAGFTATWPSNATCTYSSVAAGGASSNTAAGAGNVSDTLSLPSGGSVTYTATCVVDPAATGTLAASAAVVKSAPTLEPDTSNNSAADTDTAVTPLVFGFAKSFSPSTVNVGQVSTLTFEIDNSANMLASSGMAFVDTMPAGMVVAPAANAANACGGTLSSTPGAGAISLSGGTLSGGATCTISVDVVSSATGALANSTSPLSSNFPDAAPAAATLTVNPAGAPVFTKSFTPDTVAQGGASTISLTIDNSANFVDLAGATFDDILPAGMLLTSPVNARDTCGGSLRVGASGDRYSYSGIGVPAGQSCMIQIDVVATGTGALGSKAGDLTSNLATAVGPSATLTVTPALLSFTKTYTPDTIVQTQSTTATYVISNVGNLVDATAMAFSETLTGGLVVAASPAATSTCGPIAAAAGGTSVALTGGTLAAGARCEITVPITASTAGVITGTASVLTSSLADVPGAAATLTVGALTPPAFTAGFTPAAIAQGETSVVSFEIVNSNPVAANGLAFTASLTAGAPVAAIANASNTCGGSFAPSAGDTNLTFSGGTLAAGATCTVSVTVQGITSGGATATTSVLGSSNLPSSPSANATLAIASAPLAVSMSFAPSTIEETDVTILTYALSNGAALAATGVTLSDTLPANMQVASSPAASATCAGSFAAAPGGSSVSLSGGTLAAGGSCTITVPVTSSLLGTYPNSLETASSSLGTSSVAPATLEVLALTRGSVTIRQLSDPDGAFGFTSTEPSLNFTINTVGGTGQQGPITLTQGTYAVQQTAPAGMGNASMQCSDSDSSGDGLSGVLTLNIAPGENVTCTISSLSSQQKTVDTINQFLTKRADLILSTAPDSGRRLDRLRRGSGNASPLQFAKGDLKALLPFSTQITSGGKDFTFSTSLLQARQSAASLALAHGSPKDTMFVDNNRWDAWFEAQYKSFDQGANGEGHFAVAYFGADYLVTPDLLVGAMLQFDHMEDASAANNSSASGRGWMFGPYVTARIGERLYFDGRISAGRSTNNVSPFNTYTDQFETTRWMAQASLSGEFVRGNWTISPNASLSYYEETQEAYTDSLNILIPSQKIRLGQIQLGPTFTGNFESADGSKVSPFFGFDAMYNIGDTSGVTLSNTSSSAAVDGWRGRIRAGIKFSDKYGTKFGLSGSYDGIGQSNYETWGVKLDVSIPFN